MVCERHCHATLRAAADPPWRRYRRHASNDVPGDATGIHASHRFNVVPWHAASSRLPVHPAAAGTGGGMAARPPYGYMPGPSFNVAVRRLMMQYSKALAFFASTCCSWKMRCERGSALDVLRKSHACNCLRKGAISAVTTRLCFISMACICTHHGVPVFFCSRMLLALTN